MARPSAKQFDYMDEDRGLNPFQASARMRRKPPKQARTPISQKRGKSFKSLLSLDKIFSPKNLMLLAGFFLLYSAYSFRHSVEQHVANLNYGLWLPLISIIVVVLIIVQHIHKSLVEKRFQTSLNQLGFRNFYEYDNAVLIREMNLGREACTKIQREVINRLSRLNKAHKHSILEYEQAYANVAHELGINGAIWDQSIHGQSQVDTLKLLDQSRKLQPPKSLSRYVFSTACIVACVIGWQNLDISPYWFIPPALVAILFIRDLLPGLMLTALVILFALLLIDLSKVIVFT